MTSCQMLVKSLLAGACLALAGCGVGSASLQEAGTDPSMVASISPQTAATGDVEKVSDEATIRNAVSSADIAQTESQGISWANADTGSRGAINALVESKDEGRLCREFTATRESFEGVALYQGKTCLAGPGQWQMMAFTAK